MRRKVTYLTTGLARAGAETELILLCRRFVQAGWDVGVISMLRPGAFVPELRQLGVPLVCLEVRKNVPDPRAFWRLVRTLRSWSPDVLHCHQVHANLAGRVARIFTGIPAVICTSHCTYEGPRWREWAYRLTDPLCDLTTCVCQAGVDRYVEGGCAPAGKICFMPNAVDVERFTPMEGTRERVRRALGLTDEFVWLAVGHLRASKDYPTMLEAFRRVYAESSAARLLIAGCGPQGESLASRAQEMGIAGPVRFLGIREDVPELMEEDRDEVVRRVERAIDSLHLAIRDIRNFIFGLRPELLSGTTLTGGLAAIVEEFRHNSMIDVELQVGELQHEPTPDSTAHMLAMVNEALSNIARHSGASRVLVIIADDDSGLRLSVTDNGCGFDPSLVASLGHQGLVNMRSRAVGIGATIHIDSGNAGTTVRVILPHVGNAGTPERAHP